MLGRDPSGRSEKVGTWRLYGRVSGPRDGGGVGSNPDCGVFCVDVGRKPRRVLEGECGGRLGSMGMLKSGQFYDGSSYRRDGRSTRGRMHGMRRVRRDGGPMRLDDGGGGGGGGGGWTAVNSGLGRGLLEGTTS